MNHAIGSLCREMSRVWGFPSAQEIEKASEWNEMSTNVTFNLECWFVDNGELLLRLQIASRHGEARDWAKKSENERKEYVI